MGKRMRCPEFIQDGGGSGESCDLPVVKLYAATKGSPSVGYWCRRCGFQDTKQTVEYSAVSKETRERERMNAEVAECW